MYRRDIMTNRELRKLLRKFPRNAVIKYNHHIIETLRATVDQSGQWIIYLIDNEKNSHKDEKTLDIPRDI